MNTAKISPLLASAFLLGPILRCAAAEEAVAAQPKAACRLWEKGSVSFGGFLAAFDSTLAFGLEGAGIAVNAEELLDLDSQLTVLRLGALYRPDKSRRHQVDLTWAAYHRRGDATLNEEIEIGDVTLPVGAEVETVFNFDIIRGTYSYAVLQDDRMRIALGLEVYAVPLRYSLDVESSADWTAVEAADTTLPLPALALRGDFLLVRKLYLNAGLDAMYLEISDFKGSLLDVNVNLEYRPWKHVGLGVGYNGFTVDVEGRSDSDYPGIDFASDVEVH